MRRPHHELERRSDGRRGGDLRRPGAREQTIGHSPETDTYNSNIAIHCCYPLVGSGLEEFACDELFQSEHDTIFAPDAHRRAAVLYRLDCVFDLPRSA
jgi:hypothetical protein